MLKKILVVFLLLTLLMLNNVIINAQTGDGTLTDTNIKYIGRWDTSNASVYNSYWGGAYFKTKFTGTTVKIKLGGACDIIVNIDNGNNTTYKGANGTVNLTPTPLASGVHTLRVAARYQQLELKFQGLILDSGATTSAPDTKDIIEFVGDSITTGYGNTNGDISAYAWITGENLGYDHTQISYSGIALVTGYGYNSNKTGMITQYFKLKATDYTTSSDWDFNKYTPKAVVINIGTNDSTSGCSSATFQSTYITFLQNIRAKLPNAKIFCMRPFGGYFATETRNAVNSRNSAGDANVYFIDTTSWLVSSDYLSDGLHPNDSGQIKAANLLMTQLKNYLQGSSSYVRIMNRATGLYIDGMGNTSNGANAYQWANSSSYNQQWSIVAYGSYYLIQNRATGLYLDGMGRTSNGSICGQWTGSFSNNQQWTKEAYGSYTRFKNRGTGLYLDGMGSTSNGSNLCQWSGSGSNNQQWSLVQ